MSNVRVYLTSAAAESLPRTLPLHWDHNRPTICYIEANSAHVQDKGWLRVLLSQKEEDSRLVINLPPTAVTAVLRTEEATSPL